MKKLTSDKKIPKEEIDLVERIRTIIDLSDSISSGHRRYVTHRLMGRLAATVVQYMKLPADHGISVEYPQDRVIRHYRVVEMYNDRIFLGNHEISV